MKYREDKVDKDLRAWFVNDLTKALLRGIFLKEGALRGINNLSLKFDYPIVAFAGVNGAGKSTILAMACCAFHNGRTGFKLLEERRHTTHSPTFLFSTHKKWRRRGSRFTIRLLMTTGRRALNAQMEKE